ncbi:MAG: protein-L-isoaspartate(D-aspartate) O-methyltransferase [Thermodesulfobacteriota bacterium]|nr:protein-L-isoaspartate(D-aspartate) O-methyltransferase [Thermodesulfobacteriota bacterium]
MDPSLARQTMVEDQLKTRGIKDPEVIRAFMDVPRHKFVDEYLKYKAYADYPITIGDGQTISQPYMVALMTEALCAKKNHRVLEIGTGSGYQAAILSRIVSRVFSIERISTLASKARKIHDELGYFNINITIGDGTRGYITEAPYERIIVTAGAPHVPSALVDQLSDDGILVIPVGDESLQTLLRIRKTPEGTRQESLGGCRFVRLIGTNGWSA